MKFDDELTELAGLLRVGAETARTILQARDRDEAVFLSLAAQAEAIAARLDRIAGGADRQAPQFAPSLRLRRDR